MQTMKIPPGCLCSIYIFLYIVFVVVLYHWYMLCMVFELYMQILNIYILYLSIHIYQTIINYTYTCHTYFFKHLYCQLHILYAIIFLYRGKFVCPGPKGSAGTALWFPCVFGGPCVQVAIWSVVWAVNMWRPSNLNMDSLTFKFVDPTITRIGFQHSVFCDGFSYVHPSIF